MADLNRLFRPRSIAVIGGGTWCENVIQECRRFGFDGALWAVHPSKKTIAAVPTVSTLAALPSPPDAVFIGVNRMVTVQIVTELAAMGAGGAVCFASGFSEASEELDGAADLQAELVAAAGDMPVLGPNCYGFVNALDQIALWPDQHGLVPVSKGVAIIAQSSNIALNLTMQKRGLPIAFLATVGNQAQTGLSDIAQALLQDDRVTALGLHIEGIDDLRGFEELARMAQSLGKPIAVLKVGRSEQARVATVSHTASLAGSAEGARALFKRLGMAQVSSLSVLLEVLKIWHMAGPLPSAQIASMSCSGGEASLIADIAESSEVSFPSLQPMQKDALRAVLGPKVALANPLDYHTYIWGDTDAMARCFAAMMDGGTAELCVVILDLPREDLCDPSGWFPVFDAVFQAKDISGKPFAIMCSIAEGMTEETAKALVTKGIVPICGMRAGIDAIAAAVIAPCHPVPVFLPQSCAPMARIDEDEAKTRLARAGLCIPKRATSHGVEQAKSKAAEIGYPVVLKGLGVAHKTDVGAIALDLHAPEALERAALAMPADMFLVEEMVSEVLVELLVGIVRDAAHGMVLTLGAGGIYTEILGDTVSMIVPVGRHEVSEALACLAIAPVIAGYRGGPACSVDRIVDAVMVLQDYVMSHNVEELEVNPLLCGADFAVAADALLIGEENENG